MGGDAPETEFLETPWHLHPGFIDAIAERIRQAVPEEGGLEGAKVIFTAHSIPVSMAKASSYEEEFRETAALTAQKLGLRSYEVGFQSSPDAPPGTWLGPDVVDVIEGVAADGAEAVLLVPNRLHLRSREVLFDLDIKAREAAEQAGLRFYRAPTVGTHPAFIHMLSELIRAKMTGSGN